MQSSENSCMQLHKRQNIFVAVSKHYKTYTYWFTVFRQ